MKKLIKNPIFWVAIIAIALVIIFRKKLFGNIQVMHGGGMVGGFAGTGASSITAFKASPFGMATSSYIGCKIVDCGSGPCNCCHSQCPCNCDGTRRIGTF